MRGKVNSEFGRGGELNTIVGKGSVVEGDMKIQNSIRVDGKVHGKITATETVVVGREGEVIGEISCKHVMLAGKVQGNVTASGKVILESNASISGDIKASRLVVDEGAYLNGKCCMKDGAEPEKRNELKNKRPGNNALS